MNLFGRRQSGPRGGVDNQQQGWFAQPGFGPGPDEDYQIPEDKLVGERMDADMRRDFVKKVLSIVATELLVSFGISLLFTWEPNSRDWIMENTWFPITAAIIFIVVSCGTTYFYECTGVSVQSL